MATAEDLVARLLKSRELRIELEEGVTVTARRPSSLDVLEMRGLRGYLECATGWSGVTEALIFGEGSADAIPFDSTLWLTVAADRISWVNAVVDAVSDAAKAHAKAQAAARKN